LSDPATPESIRVVVADDDPTILRLIETALPLAAPDIEIVGTAQSVETLARQVGEYQPDIVMVDRHFNSRDGLELGRDIRDKAPDSALVLWTGTTSSELADTATKAGFNGVVEKSADIEGLAQIIRNLAKSATDG
jgi:DNA-binding NarL/FixJ family response regulator